MPLCVTSRIQIQIPLRYHITGNSSVPSALQRYHQETQGKKTSTSYSLERIRETEVSDSLPRIDVSCVVRLIRGSAAYRGHQKFQRSTDQIQTRSAWKSVEPHIISRLFWLAKRVELRVCLCQLNVPSNASWCFVRRSEEFSAWRDGVLGSTSAKPTSLFTPWAGRRELQRKNHGHTIKMQILLR